MNLPECRLPKTHKEIVRIMVFSIPCLKDGQATSNTKARAPLPGFSRVIWDEWGKKGVHMDTKALKKQMGAAIAMVLVAAVALGSATFAWFVTNSKVEATTSTISAQSNAAFMNIKYNESATTSDLRADHSTLGDTQLYPAQWANNFSAEGNKVPNAGVYQFETAFAQTVDAATMDADSLKLVGDPTTASTANAKGNKYAVANLFNISSKGSDLVNLKVTGAAIKTGDEGNTNLDDALRVLVVCGKNWAVCNKDGVVVDSSGTTTGLLAGTVKAGEDTVVNTYVYYDGNADNVYTNKLADLKNASAKITLTFKADPQNNA